VYVASVALGARPEQTIRAFLEAESYAGPSLILAYSHCIAHGIDMRCGLQHQHDAVESGRWLLYRHDPRRAARGEPPLRLDGGPPRRSLAEAMATENRFAELERRLPGRAAELVAAAELERQRRLRLFQALAGLDQRGLFQQRIAARDPSNG
jgi:pyruvate-ferredoxin/flavodoxin oxidoreductase